MRGQGSLAGCTLLLNFEKTVDSTRERHAFLAMFRIIMMLDIVPTM